ncbi:MAG TPA: DUF2182 domain-containing protein [Gemmatimonadaceae bacterium]|nr:DUF2182 domain-containing protein [Gemmatimonadaceae bacterium]
MISERASRRAILGVAALLFAASAAITVRACGSMGAGSGMPMPGGWTMSMVWMRMPGQWWPGAAASFLGMWMLMMVAMMLPSLVPMLWRYREAVRGTDGQRLGARIALVGLAYFFVWTLIGAAVFALGALLAALEMREPALARLVPIAAGVVVLIAGASQLTRWKARHLACWRDASWHGGARRATAGTAWSHGVRLGLQCGVGGAGPMAILLVAGIMDLRAMAVMTAVVTAERLAPAGERVARIAGIVAVGAGLALIVGAAADRSSTRRATGASPTSVSVGDARVVQPLRRPMRHLAAYGSANRYRPESRSSASGRSGEYVTHAGGWPRVIAAKLAMTVIVKAMDSQRWLCRTTVFQLMASSRADRRACRPSSSIHSAPRRTPASGPA